MTKQINCPRCDGTGFIVDYAHVRDGQCFKCNGTGKVSAPRPKSAKQLAAEAQRKADNDARIEAMNIEFRRKYAIALPMYENDKRLRVTPDHAWYKHHIVELAQLDRVWDTL